MIATKVTNAREPWLRMRLIITHLRIRVQLDENIDHKHYQIPKAVSTVLLAYIPCAQGNTRLRPLSRNLGRRISSAAWKPAREMGKEPILYQRQSTGQMFLLWAPVGRSRDEQKSGIARSFVLVQRAIVR